MWNSFRKMHSHKPLFVLSIKSALDSMMRIKFYFLLLCEFFE